MNKGKRVTHMVTDACSEAKGLLLQKKSLSICVCSMVIGQVISRLWPGIIGGMFEAHNDWSLLTIKLLHSYVDGKSSFFCSQSPVFWRNPFWRTAKSLPG
jgi:hypothetical protein